MSICALLVVGAGATLVIRGVPQRDSSDAAARTRSLELVDEIAAPLSSRVERTLEAVVGTPAAAMQGMAIPPATDTPADSVSPEPRDPEPATRRGPRLLGKPVSLPDARQTRRRS